ncbi:MAG TPA: hypothetical protein VFO14_05365 [Vicinamibacterales bacterium]|nr:hypothetical protein [Vicinamibacterales bacterium]
MAKKVSVKSVHKSINGVLKKLEKIDTKKSEKLQAKMKTFKSSIDCGQTLQIEV